MAKHVLKVFGAILAVAMASQASAVVTGKFHVDKKGPSYAKEIFGDGSDDLLLEYGPTATAMKPVIVLHLKEHVNDQVADNETIAASSEAELTVTLTGAAFGTSVGVSALTAYDDYTPAVVDDPATTDQDETAASVLGSPLGQTDIDIRRTAGGSRGDGSVTFKLTLGSARSNLALAFTSPPLTNAMGAMLGTRGIMASVAVTPTTRDGFISYPPAVPGAGSGTIISPASAALTLKVATGLSDGMINLADRSQLVFANPQAPQRLLLATAMVTHDRTLVAEDGATKVAVEERDGAGYLTIDVSGEVRDGDAVFADYIPGPVVKMDAGEALTVEDGTSGTLEVDLEDVLAKGAASANVSVYYVPNGKDSLRSGAYKTVFGVDYIQSSNLNPRSTGTTVEVMYQGAGDAVMAYAIAPHMEGGDMSNVRIRCDSPADCPVHLACDGADGAGYFGKLATDVPARGVDTLNAMEIGETIMADTEDFAGRMSCLVIGSRISVQVLTRSGDTLVNNSYVGGPLEARIRTAINQAKMATAEAAKATAAAEAAKKAAEG